MKNDIYTATFENEEFSSDYEDVLQQLKQLDKRIHKMKKKKKGAKRGKKRKLKKRIRTLEREYRQLKQFTFFLAYQYKEYFAQQPWWQGAICNTLPKAFELTTAVINKLPDKTQPMYLTDGSDRK